MTVYVTFLIFTVQTSEKQLQYSRTNILHQHRTEVENTKNFWRKSNKYGRQKQIKKIVVPIILLNFIVILNARK